MLVERCVEIYKVRKEATRRHLAGKSVEVVVRILGQIAHSALLLPYLYREYGRGTVAHTLVCAVEQLPDNTATLGRSVCTIVYGAEHHLVAATAMNSVHIVDKCLHSLMHTAHGAVHGMLQQALVALKLIKRTAHIVAEIGSLHFRQVATRKALQIFDLLHKRRAHKWRQIEIECRDGLPAVHFVLSRFHRYAGYYACRFDTLGRARLPMAGHKAVVQNVVERVLHAGKALGRVIVLVVDMDIIAAHGIACFRRQQIVVNERLGGFAGKLHHHSRRRIRIHIGVLAGDIVVLGLDYLVEHIAGLGLAGYATLVAICYVALCDFLSGAVHKFKLHHILNILHRHTLGAPGANAVGYLLDKSLVLAKLRCKHGLAYGCLDFFFVIAHDATVAFHYYLYHVFYNFPKYPKQRAREELHQNNTAKL